MLDREEVEREVLGGMLRCNSELADKLSRSFVPDIFANRKHRLICEAINKAGEEGVERSSKMALALHSRLEPDVYCIIQDLPYCSKVDMAIKYLYDINISEKSRLVADKLYEISSGDKAMDALDFFREYCEDMIDRCRDLPGKSEQLDEYAQTILSGNSMERIATPFDYLNNALGGGFSLGEFVLIGGTPGAGKTSIMLYMALTAAIAKRKCVFIESEMTSNQLLFRLNGMHTGTPINDLRIPENFNEHVAPFLSFMHTVDFDHVIDTERTTKSLEVHMNTAIRNGAKIIFVDYLQIFKNPKSKADEEFYEVKKISETLRRFALKHNVVVVAASSLNRNESAKDKPGLQSLYGTSQLGHDASIALVVYTDKIDDEKEMVTKCREVNLAIIKARDAGRGEIKLIFQLDCQRFEQLFKPKSVAVMDYSEAKTNEDLF